METNLHFFLDTFLKFSFFLEWLSMIMISVIIKKISFKSSSTVFLLLSSISTFSFIISVTIVKCWSVWWPCCETDPTKFIPTRLKFFVMKFLKKFGVQTWFRHITWLHPPSFSIVALHFGHSFVLAWIQLYVSESSSHFFFHNLSKSHWTGSCHFEPHDEQSVSPHSHATSIPTLWSCDWIFMTKLQSGVLQKSIDLEKILETHWSRFILPVLRYKWVNHQIFILIDNHLTARVPRIIEQLDNNLVFNEWSTLMCWAGELTFSWNNDVKIVTFERFLPSDWIFTWAYCL